MTTQSKKTIEYATSPLPKDKNKTEFEKYNFVEAIATILSGDKVTRIEWANKDIYCLIKDKFLMLHRDNKFFNWIIASEDMEASDWIKID